MSVFQILWISTEGCFNLNWGLESEIFMIRFQEKMSQVFWKKLIKVWRKQSDLKFIMLYILQQKQDLFQG